MKTKEELNALKEELKQVSGGLNNELLPEFIFDVTTDSRNSWNLRTDDRAKDIHYEFLP